MYILKDKVGFELSEILVYSPMSLNDIKIADNLRLFEEILMTKRSLLIALCAILLATIARPVQAQDGGDGEATAEFLALIFQANDNLYASGTYSYEATQSQQQIIGSGVGLRRSELSRESVYAIEDATVRIDANGVPVAFEAEMSQTDTRRVNNVIRTDANLVVDYELRFLAEEGLFVRISGISGAINENAIGEDSASSSSETLLTGWVNVTANAEQLAEDLAYLDAASNDINFFDALNLDAILNVPTGVTWTADMVERVRERASDDDQQRIFEVTLDPVIYLTSLGLADLVASSDLAGNTDLMLQELYENTTLNQTITLDIADDGTANFAVIETEMIVLVNFSDGSGAEANSPDATGGVELDLDMETVTTVTYDDIGDDFELSAPEPEIDVEVVCDQESLDVVFTIVNTGANMPAAVTFTVSREGEVPDSNELQLEAGSTTTVERRDGEYVLAIPAFEINETITCVAPEEEPAAE